MNSPGDPRLPERLHMMETQFGSPDRGITDMRVLEAMKKVPRHLFVPKEAAAEAYEDHPVSIGCGQTISQPFIVAYMTQELAVQHGMRILEIGTGSGYQSAILAELGAEVFSMEYYETLANRARAVLTALGYHNVQVRHGDGTEGWPEQAPFDAILAACAPEHVPEALKRQLAIDGHMILPVGGAHDPQALVRVTRTGPNTFRTEKLLPVRFVPMR
jgi:protein-L-isoaspartate(D-aspartate) O-methyltransferase